jgi:hypothetical protein
MGPGAGGKPEIERGVNEVDHFLIIEVTASVVHTSFSCLESGLWLMHLAVILARQLEYLLLEFVFFVHIINVSY